jgi:hypothetical protein
MAEEHFRFIDDLKIGPHGRLDGVEDPLAVNNSMSN